MTMKLLLIFSLYLISAAAGGSMRVSGFSGGGVLIKCRYETKYTSNTKYFCKSSAPKCVDQIKTDVKNKWVNSGRFSLFDDTSAEVFWVKISNLTINDSGLYQCAIDKWFRDNYTPVELKVKEDPEFGKSISVTGRAGGSVNISCKYPQSLRSSPKFLCRRVDSGDCVYKTLVNQSGEWINQGKYSLHDDRVNNTLSVIISDVREGDSGEFWCGAESDWESDNGYKLYITHISLTMTATKKEEAAETSATASTAQTSTRASTAQTSTRASTLTTKNGNTTTAQVSTTKKSATGAGTSVQRSSAPNSSETTKSTSSLTTQSTSPPGFPTSTVIPVVAVVLALLLMGLLLFILVLQKKRKTQDSASGPSESLRGFSDGRKMTLAEVDYEDIKEYDVSTIYTTVKLPKDSSSPSSTLYGNVQLPTSLCNILNPIYSTTELPTNLSDTGECTNYSTVNAIKKAGTDTVTTATGNKQQGFCEYATVKT
ncbi:polymeric immunoglobulin receptor-like [Hoplias malabaricus]|uniref:polymeric immunoglobulin receptor-like n=1 Tax=Hoplias malabaricus TaxID=27720 RepID=UPI00346242D6